MIAPEKNGKHAPSGRAADEPNGPQVEIVLVDRLDALERALGTVRRRQMTLQIHSLARRAPDELVVTFRGTGSVALPDRWIAELGALVDVRQVKVDGK